MTDAELRRVCRDRPLLTNELHEGNAFYGHDFVLKRYIGWPARDSLPVAIEHGVMINDSIWPLDERTLMPMFLCSGVQHAASYTRRTGRPAEAIGPLLRYAASVPPPPRDRRVLLVFPAHSNHRLAAQFDVNVLIDRLEAYRAEFDDVRVCLYWRDVLSGLAGPFVARGFRCVSAGHMFARDFLLRLSEILASSTHVLSNEIGSQILYAIVADRPAWIERQHVEYAPSANGVTQSERPEYRHPNVVRMFELFDRRRDVITDEQRRFVDELTGTTRVRSREELGRLVETAARERERRRSLLGRARELAWRSRYWGGVAHTSLRLATERVREASGALRGRS